MLNLKIFEAYGDVYLKTMRYDAGVKKVMAGVKKIPSKIHVDVEVRTNGLTTAAGMLKALRANAATPIRFSFTADRGRATATLSLLMQQIAALKIGAKSTIPIRADLKQWRVAMKTVAADIARVRRSAVIPVAVNTTRASANVARLTAQLNKAKAAARITVTTRRAGGSGGGRSGGGGGGFVSGMAQGFGLPFSGGNPSAMAGQLTAGALSGAIGAAMDLETRFAHLRKTTGVTGEGFEKLKGELTAVATTMRGISFDDLIDTATMGGRMGVASDKLARFATDIGMLTVALDDIPAEEVATKVGRILNVFGRGMEDAVRFGSALNKLDDSSTASAKDLLDVSNRISGVAAALEGFTPQKVVALATAMKDAGVSNEVAGTAMTQVFSRMSTDAASFAKVAGESVGAFAAKLKADPIEALKAFMNGLKQFDDAGKFAALESVGLKGARVKSSILQLSGVIDRLDGYLATANAEWISGSSILSEYDAMGNTTAGVLARVGNQVKVTAATVGEFLLPILRAAGDSLSQFGQDASAALGRNKEAIAAFAGKVAEGVGLVAVAFEEWPTSLAAASLAMEAILASIRDNVGALGAYLREVLVSSFRDAFMALPTMAANAMANLLSKFSGNAAAGLLLSHIDPKLGAALLATPKGQEVPLMQGVQHGPPIALPKFTAPDMGLVDEAMKPLWEKAAAKKAALDAKEKAMIAPPAGPGVANPRPRGIKHFGDDEEGDDEGGDAMGAAAARMNKGIGRAARAGAHGAANVGGDAFGERIARATEESAKTLALLLEHAIAQKAKGNPGVGLL